MCLQDFELGVATTARRIVKVVNHTIEQLTGPDPTRVGVTLCPHPTYDYTVAPHSDVATNEGINIYHGTTPVHLSIKDYGTMIQGPLFGSFPNTAMSITVFDSVMPTITNIPKIWK